MEFYSSVLGSMGIFTQLEMKFKVQTFGGWQFLTIFTIVYYPFFFFLVSIPSS